MIIKMHDKTFSVFGDLIVEDDCTKAYVMDELNNAYLLTWRSDEGPDKGMVSVLVLEV